MKKVSIYADANDNNSLSNIAHALILKGFHSFTVGLTRLTFNAEDDRDALFIKERLTDTLKSVNIKFHNISIR